MLVLKFEANDLKNEFLSIFFELNDPPYPSYQICALSVKAGPKYA